MSRTDKDRPYRIRTLDRLEPTRTSVWHCPALHAKGECDADERDQLLWGKYNNSCGAHLRTKVHVTSRRKPHRRAWFGSERAAQRNIARELTRAANSGQIEDIYEVEDVIDNRKTHVAGAYPRGWWD